ncbi:MAG: SBBP repeat-containing protein [Deltaproteobacteria bacterium]
MNKAIIVVTTLLCVFFSAAMLSAAAGTARHKAPSAAAPLSGGYQQTVRAAYIKLPLSFVKNEGQKDPSVLYYEQGSGHATVFTKTGISLFPGRGKDSVITLSPVHASDFTVEALDLKQGTVNYFIGRDQKNWKTSIPTYGAILYKGIYPGIDMKVYGTNNQLEYDLIVAPGADPDQIRLAYKGAKNLSITPEGDLAIALSENSILQKKPIIYQTINNRRRDIKGRFVLAEANTYRFEVGAYNKKHPLVIDPVLVYSTYLGGTDEDHALAVAIDASGNAYVAGFTWSDNFPTLNAYQSSPGGFGDAFVTKFNTSGRGLVYSTYLGGSDEESIQGIAVDASGNAHVAGFTLSTDFPTQNPYQAANAGSYDAFIAKLDASGSTLLYATYLGGSGDDHAMAIALDASGNAYAAGDTDSTDFPTLNAYQGSNPEADDDAFVTKLSSSGNSLVYSTYLGGTAYDMAFSIAVDPSGNAYVAGSTDSTDFPIQNAYQGSYGGGMYDAFVTKLSTAGSALVYSTYLGGSDDEEALAIAVDSSGNAYVAGYTWSDNFPTQNPYQGTFAGGDGSDAFVAKFNTPGNALVYATYLGGNGTDVANAIAVDSSGKAYVAGGTSSTDFPTRYPYRSFYLGNTDAFVTKFIASGNTLIYSTYLGGIGLEEAYAIAVDSTDHAYVAGYTLYGTFPTRNPYQAASAGYCDAFVTKFYEPAKNDFNADRRTDILWRNTATGQNMVWFMNNVTRLSHASLADVTNLAWTIAGTGDFNNDGKTEILWRNTTTGQNLVWFMNGTTRASYAYLMSVSDQAWTIAGTGDFNNDGKADILWRNTATGKNQVWHMNGVTRLSYVYLRSAADLTWTIAGTGDFNNDGKTDILWRNSTTGRNQVWYMNGATKTSAAYLTTNTDQAWRIAGTGDFNNDGKTDILWRNTTTGRNMVWYMDGVNRTSYAYPPTLADPTWTIVGK